MQLIKNKKIFFGLIIALFFVSCLLVFEAVYAFDRPASSYLNEIAGKVDLGKKAMPLIISSIINGVLGFLGVIFLVIIIYAGLKLMMAGGNEETVNQAKGMIKWSIIGVIVILGAYGLTYYVVNEVIKATTWDLTRPEIPIEGEEDEESDYVCAPELCSSYDDDEGGCYTLPCCYYDSRVNMCLYQ